jgi:hypothetical protein
MVNAVRGGDLTREGALVNSKTPYERPYQPESSLHTGTRTLPVGVAWPLTLLLSLGLWAPIWLAVSSLLSH